MEISSSSKCIRITPEQTFKIIDGVENNPVLYRTDHPHYRSKERKEAAWRIIATNVGIDKRLVKKKWENLKKNFNKRLKNEVREGEKPNNHHIDWNKRLAFCKPYLNVKPTIISHHSHPQLNKVQTQSCQEATINRTYISNSSSAVYSSIVRNKPTILPNSNRVNDNSKQYCKANKTYSSLSIQAIPCQLNFCNRAIDDSKLRSKVIKTSSLSNRVSPQPTTSNRINDDSIPYCEHKASTSNSVKITSETNRVSPQPTTSKRVNDDSIPYCEHKASTSNSVQITSESNRVSPQPTTSNRDNDDSITYCEHKGSTSSSVEIISENSIFNEVIVISDDSNDGITSENNYLNTIVKSEKDNSSYCSSINQVSGEPNSKQSTEPSVSVKIEKPLVPVIRIKQEKLSDDEENEITTLVRNKFSPGETSQPIRCQEKLDSCGQTEDNQCPVTKSCTTNQVTSDNLDHSSIMSTAHLDATQLLFLSFARTVNSFTPKRQMLTKKKINQIIFEEELKHHMDCCEET